MCHIFASQFYSFSWFRQASLDRIPARVGQAAQNVAEAGDGDPVHANPGRPVSSRIQSAGDHEAQHGLHLPAGHVPPGLQQTLRRSRLQRNERTEPVRVFFFFFLFCIIIHSTLKKVALIILPSLTDPRRFSASFSFPSSVSW